MIEIFTDNQIMHWVLSAKPCNEIGETMLESLELAYKRLQEVKPRALIIRSENEFGFSAGADLKALYLRMSETKSSQTFSEISSFIDRIHNVMNQIDSLEIPSIAVLHGVCFGGGFELALTCDLLIAEPTLRVAFPELRLGLIPGFGGIPRLRRDFGNAAIRDLLFTGRSFNAQKCQQLGLVSQIVAEGKGKDIAVKMAEQMIKFDPRVMNQAKKFIKKVPYEELEIEKKLFLELIEQPTVLQALKTFYESESIRPYLI